jgi:tol-pal system protein YbgF
MALAVFIVIVLPLSAAECPVGTRNNYKGECVLITPTADSSSEKKKQAWVEPKTDAAEVVDIVVEEAETKDKIASDGTGDTSKSIVESEEVATGGVSGTPDSDEVDMTELATIDESNAGELVKALSMVQELRDEIKELLNRVELQRYELEKLRGRQMDLYDDLDHRMRKQERLMLAVPSPVSPSVESIVNVPEIEEVFVEPAPINTGNDGPSLSAETIANSAEISNLDTDDLDIVSVRQPIPINAGDKTLTSSDGMTTALSVSKNEVGLAVLAGEPNPVVAGADLSVRSVDSKQGVIALSKVESVNQGTKSVDSVDSPNKIEDVTRSVVPEITDTLAFASSPLIDNTDVVSKSITSDESQLNLDAMQKPVYSEEGKTGGQPSAEGNISGEEKAPAPVVTLSSPAASGEEKAPAPVVTLSSPAASGDPSKNDELVSRQPTVSLGEQDAYDHAFNMLKQSRYEDAAEEFANFLRRYKSSQLTDDAWYWMAEAYYVTRNYEQALIAFNTVVSYFTNSPRIPASRLKIGYIQYEIADYVGARETLTLLLQDFPAHRVAVSAEARLKKMDREDR